MDLDEILKNYKPRIGDYVDKLKRNVPFSFSRYGDGEWNAILGKPGMNCDGHEFFPEMGKLLKQTVLNPLDYFYAIQGAALRGEGKRISLLLKNNMLPPPSNKKSTVAT